MRQVYFLSMERHETSQATTTTQRQLKPHSEKNGIIESLYYMKNQFRNNKWTLKVNYDQLNVKQNLYCLFLRINRVFKFSSKLRIKSNYIKLSKLVDIHIICIIYSFVYYIYILFLIYLIQFFPVHCDRHQVCICIRWCCACATHLKLLKWNKSFCFCLFFFFSFDLCVCFF